MTNKRTGLVLRAPDAAEVCHRSHVGRRCTCCCTAQYRSRQFIEKEINGRNPAISGNDKIRPGVSWRLTRTA
jgi:hypothetical protein